MAATNPADLVAEALMHAYAVTADRIYTKTSTEGTCRFVTLPMAEHGYFETNHWATREAWVPQHARLMVRADVHDAMVAHLAARVVAERERAERAEVALDAAEREASLRLDRIFMLRLCVQQLGPKELLDADDAAMRERPRQYGPMAVTIDKPGGFAFVGHTGDTYAEGRAIREATSALNPGGRVRLWRLVCVEDWCGEEAPRG